MTAGHAEQVKISAIASPLDKTASIDENFRFFFKSLLVLLTFNIIKYTLHFFRWLLSER